MQQLAYVDQALGTFKQALVRGGWWDRSLVVLLSDHGESLGDHGEASHGYFIYQSTMAVPLMIHWPNGGPGAPAREAHPVGLIDVAPTILDYLHIPAPPSFHGQSLLAPRKPPGASSERASTPTTPSAGRRCGACASGISSSSRHRGPNSTTSPPIPAELHNLAATDTARTQSMRTELANLMSRLRPKGPAPAANMSARDRALLGSLGYVAPGPQTNATGARPDPKDRMAEFRMYEDAQVLLYQRRLPEAIATLRKILAQDPQNTLARRDLGGAYLEQKQYAKARDALAQVLLAAPRRLRHPLPARPGVRAFRTAQTGDRTPGSGLRHRARFRPLQDGARFGA